MRLSDLKQLRSLVKKIVIIITIQMRFSNGSIIDLVCIRIFDQDV